MKYGLTLVALGWAGLIALGMFWVNDYGSAPGQSAVAPAHWPAQADVAVHPDQHVLLMMVHPQCPCSRASLVELQEILKQHIGPVDAHVLFYEPEHAPADWFETDLWNMATSMEGVRVARDMEGQEAKKFGTFTSGQVLLYDPAGTLRFAGGITPSRGHTGDSAGKVAVLEVLAESQSLPQSNPPQAAVFGCPIHGEGAECTESFCVHRQR